MNISPECCLAECTHTSVSHPLYEPAHCEEATGNAEKTRYRSNERDIPQHSVELSPTHRKLSTAALLFVAQTWKTDTFILNI